MAVGGDIRWPPVGRFNGRLREDPHGRRRADQALTGPASGRNRPKSGGWAEKQAHKGPSEALRGGAVCDWTPDSATRGAGSLWT